MLTFSYSWVVSQLKEGILLDRCQALLPLKEISGVPIQTKLDDAQCIAHDRFQKAKQVEISIQDNQIHPSEQSSAYQYYSLTRSYFTKEAIVSPRSTG